MIQNVRSLNFNFNETAEVWISSGVNLALLPEHKDEHLPEQDVALPVCDVHPPSAGSDLSLAELDHVVLVGDAGLEGAREG